MKKTKILIFACLILFFFIDSSLYLYALEIGTVLYKTSENHSMIGRVGYLTEGGVNEPYLQVPCNPVSSPPLSGHVALYIGMRDGEHKIIHAILPEIIESPLSLFVNENEGQVFIGAKIPAGQDVHGNELPRIWQDCVVSMANELKGEDYDLYFKQQKGTNGGNWTCVGLIERLYEFSFMIGEEYDITPNGFYEKFFNGYRAFQYSSNENGLVYEYFYSEHPDDPFFQNCIFAPYFGQLDFEYAYATWAFNKEFSEVKHPLDQHLGRENNGKAHIFWPYTQFKQDTLKSVRCDLNIGTTKVNIINGPSRENPIYICQCNEIIELGLEVLETNNQKNTNLTKSNFNLAIEKNENGRCIAINDFSYDNQNKIISFNSSTIPFDQINAGIYEIRVDYKDGNGKVLSSYTQDNSLIIPGPPIVTSSLTIKNIMNSSNYYTGQTLEATFTIKNNSADCIYFRTQ